MHRRVKPSTGASGRWVTKPADPMVAVLQQAIQDSGMTVPQIAAKAMCTYQTVQRIVDGATVMPRNQTRDRVLEACGIEQRFYRNGKRWAPTG